MSSYYSDILTPAALPGSAASGTHHSDVYNQEAANGKMEATFYPTPVSVHTTGYEGTLHSSMPSALSRFPGYDSVSTVPGKSHYESHMLDPYRSPSGPGLGFGSQKQQYSDGLNNCILPDGVFSSPNQSHHHHHHQPTPSYNPSLVNPSSQQPQSVPIYPWMRSLTGGKYGKFVSRIVWLIFIK